MIRLLFDPRTYCPADLLCRRCGTERNLRWHLLRRLVTADAVVDETLCPKCALGTAAKPDPGLTADSRPETAPATVK